jgi:endonuclease G
MRRRAALIVLLVTLLPGARGELLPSGEGIVIRHAYYTLAYNPLHKQASWVYHELTRGRESVIKRTDNFRADPVLGNLSATPADYRGSGYDRGHLCPAADMAFDETAMRETFYMSNISPQDPSFNRGIWKRLEEAIRQRAAGEDTLYVVTGPLFRDNKGTIGAGVTVPGHFYKLFYSPARQQMIAYLLPNERGDQPLEHHAVPVDSVEKWTGIDFFPLLPDDLERLLEADTLSHLEQPAGGTTPPERASENGTLLLVTILLVMLLVLVVFVLYRRSRRR